MSLIPLAISLGAVVGALSRYYLTLSLIKKWGAQFPYGTFLANLTGSYLIGFISTFATQHIIPVESQKFLLIGFLGGYTTFSSYILDSANFFSSHRPLLGLFYWFGSPILGFLCVQLGILAAQKLG